MEKITDDTIRQTIVSTMVETVDAMTAMTLEAVDDSGPDGLGDQRMVAAIHFGGEIMGVMSVNLSEAFAKKAAAAMLGIEADAIDNGAQIEDVIGELVTIVAGNLKTEFFDAGLACVMSTPSITTGSDYKIAPLDIAPPLTATFRHASDYVQVELCAKEDIGADIDSTSDRSSASMVERIAGLDIETVIVKSVIDVFDTMLEMNVEAIEEVPEAFDEEMRTVGSVTFAGEVDGMFSIQVNDDFGKTMTAAMLGIEVDQVERQQEVYDVIREMSNIIGGNLRSHFVDAGLSCVLSTPSIANGRDFKVRPTRPIRPARFLFSHNRNVIIVEAGIRRDDAAVGESVDQAPQAGQAPETLPLSTPAPVGNDVEPFKNVGLVMNIPLQVTVELGRSRRRINDVLKMGPGSVVEMEQMEGEPVDILINQTLIAKGVVVVEKEKYGIRISEIVSRGERMKSIR